MSEDECVSVTRHVNRSAHKLVIGRARSSAVTSRILRPDWWVWFGWFKENFLTVNMLKMRGPRGVVWEGVFGVYIVQMDD